MFEINTYIPLLRMCGLCTNGYIFVCPEEPQQWQNPLPTTTNSWNPIQTVKAQAQDHRSFHTSLPIDTPPPTISLFDISDYERKKCYSNTRMSAFIFFWCFSSFFIVIVIVIFVWKLYFRTVLLLLLALLLFAGILLQHIAIKVFIVAAG